MCFQSKRKLMKQTNTQCMGSLLLQRAKSNEIAIEFLVLLAFLCSKHSGCAACFVFAAAHGESSAVETTKKHDEILFNFNNDTMNKKRKTF